MNGIPIYDIEKAKSNLIIFLREALSDKLGKTDHVHFSEFLTQGQKDILLALRIAQRTEYVTFKSSITNSTAGGNLRQIKRNISNWINA